MGPIDISWGLKEWHMIPIAIIFIVGLIQTGIWIIKGVLWLIQHVQFI